MKRRKNDRHRLFVIVSFVVTGGAMMVRCDALPAQTGGQESRAPAEIGQWDRFEATVSNTSSYSNPYRDVTLNVRFTAPDGKSVDIWGFYDGGANWRFRLMPDQTGMWRYNATFSDGSPGAHGEFQCVSSDVPGMLSADEANPLWFGFKGGGHALVRSFHVGDRFFAENNTNAHTGETWSAQQRKAFLDWAQEQGYNMLSIACHYLNRPRKTRGLGWDTPELWNRSGNRPRAEEYRKMEAILDDLSRWHAKATQEHAAVCAGSILARQLSARADRDE